MTTTNELRRALQQKYGEKPVTILGTIAAVDENSKTCNIDDDGFIMYGIRLQSVTNAAAGILKVPKIGAQALAVKIEDGDGFMLLDCAEYSKIIFNGGNNGGLINIQSLVNKINAIENDLNSLKTVFKSWTPVAQDGGSALKTAAADWADQTITKTKTKDLEDKTVTH